MVGFLTLLAGRCFAAFCAWTPGRWVGVLSLLFGGSGAALAAHVLLKSAYVLDIVRFIGGSIVHDELTPLGQRVAAWMTSPGIAPRDLPMEPLSYFLIKGDFHPPLSGFLLLAFAAALIAVQETGASGRQRALHYALLAATLPLALISNAWILPLQLLLVGGWFLFDALRGAKGYLAPALVGLAAATALEYPFLLQFTQQAIGNNAAIGVTGSADHTPWLGWLITFWPVLGILILGPLNRERRPLALFLVAVWTVALVATECLYNHDIYGAQWSRFNSTLKWWPWVYAGIVVTLGALQPRIEVAGLQVRDAGPAPSQPGVRL